VSLIRTHHTHSFLNQPNNILAYIIILSGYSMLRGRGSSCVFYREFFHCNRTLCFALRCGSPLVRVCQLHVTVLYAIVFDFLKGLGYRMRIVHCPYVFGHRCECAHARAHRSDTHAHTHTHTHTHTHAHTQQPQQK
jgi:hypothetical protein